MKYRVDWSFLPALLLLSSCAAFDSGSMPRQHISPVSEQEPRIELAIREHKFIVVKAEARLGRPIMITVHNEDSVMHGFVPTFNGQAVQAEGEGARVRVDGMEGFHVDPGKTLTIRLTLEQVGTIRFECDLHAHMKEEQLYIDIRPSRHR